MHMPNGLKPVAICEFWEIKDSPPMQGIAVTNFPKVYMIYIIFCVAHTWHKLLKDLLGVESSGWDAPGRWWEFYGDCFLLMHWWAESVEPLQNLPLGICILTVEVLNWIPGCVSKASWLRCKYIPRQHFGFLSQVNLPSGETILE